MPRYRLTIEYDGRPYRGFQAQGELPSVQGSIEKAVLGFTGETLRIHAAGRTDTGVHATGQVVHVDLEKAWPADVVRYRLLREQRTRIEMLAAENPSLTVDMMGDELAKVFRFANRVPLLYQASACAMSKAVVSAPRSL